MITVSVCHEYAEQCRAMAKAVRDKTQRALFLGLADQWDILAKSSPKFLQHKRKIEQRMND